MIKLLIMCLTPRVLQKDAESIHIHITMEFPVAEMNVLDEEIMHTKMYSTFTGNG
jgi:hypothetical protein